jgi:hypothetical protein
MTHDQDEQFDPIQSLKIIRETIDLAQQTVRENGFHLLLWGWLVVAAGLTSGYMGTVLHHDFFWMPWPLMSVIGVPIAFIYEGRRGNRQKRTNLVHQWYGSIWMVFGITVFVSVGIMVTYQVPPTPIILSIIGFALYMSGTILRFNPLKWGAAVAWAGSLACLPIAQEAHGFVMAVCSVLGYLIPGYLLRAKSQESHV